VVIYPVLDIIVAQHQLSTSLLVFDKLLCLTGLSLLTVYKISPSGKVKD
jgi:hypothetical protein